MSYCPVCGNVHAEVSACPKYGVNVCGAHCEVCEYKIGSLPISGGSCGYNLSTKALKVPIYIATEGEVIEIKKSLAEVSENKLAATYERLTELYKGGSAEYRSKQRAVLEAYRRELRDRADDVIAKNNIPQMKTEDIIEYRRQLCRLIAENVFNPKLKRAVYIALELCINELKKRGE